MEGPPSEPSANDAPDAAKASPAQVLLRFENISKRFGASAAVDRLSLDIAPGEFFALLGPSGCGKTTLLRLVAGFETPDTGRVLLDGQDLARIPPHLRPVNMMFQSYALFPHMTVAANVAFGLRQDRMARKAIAERVAEMLALVQLEGLENRKPHQLSGGQRQRVALARALAKRPKVLLLDEPMAALDKKLRAETQTQLATLQRRLGTAFVIVTHDQQEAMALADRIAMMENGQIVQVGAPADLYARPVTRAVAGFFGETNLIDGVVARVHEGRIQVDCGPLGYVRATAFGPMTLGSRASVAVRPERIRMASEQPADVLVNSMPGTIEAVRYFGDTWVYSVRMRAESSRILRVSLPFGARTDERRLRIGAPIWLIWDSAAAIAVDH
jgi:putrescine transport system ATP-binding protein